MSDELSDFLKPIYFRFLPISAIAGIVKKHGFDDSQFEGVWCGEEGRVQVPIDGQSLEAHRRGVLVTWHKMEVSGKFEVTAYAY